MKDFLKKALSTLVVLDESEGKTKPTVVPPARSAATRPTFRTAEVPVPQQPQATIRISQDVADKFQAYFMELFQNMDMPGPDYYEFWQACDSLEEAIPDVRARMKAAFKMLQKQGLAKEFLISTANQYIAGIAADGVKFRAAVDEKRKTELGGKTAELEATQQSIAGDLEKIVEQVAEIGIPRQRY